MHCCGFYDAKSDKVAQKNIYFVLPYPEIESKVRSLELHKLSVAGLRPRTVSVMLSC
jgi:hypothetical protein